ncbi:MAG: PilZ domain-containing protein [Candidatus Omnitrophica bacterium]|nr:PilZ domain-containing protein [Candidatus Omnitrophota bacterium]
MDGQNNFYKFSDRRKYPRINANITYSIKDSQDFFISQSSKNISSGGIAFFAREKIMAGTILDLRLNLPDATEVQAMVSVVWRERVVISEDETICCELGVEFISLDQNNRNKIAKYVFLRLDKN